MNSVPKCAEEHGDENIEEEAYSDDEIGHVSALHIGIARSPYYSKVNISKARLAAVDIGC